MESTVTSLDHDDLPVRSSSPDAAADGDAPPPVEIRVFKVLGHGRAARAQLVDATFADGTTKRCVEKVFAPGLLTRTIYFASYQTPFGYQKNRDAILTAFYRRRVAAAIIDASDIDAKVALPIYVRYCNETQAWVLAAEWIDGRGIRPAPPKSERTADSPSEIQTLVSVMRKLEAKLIESGLVGSGWQVAPRAMVSTANLLRVDDQYTIIDLESGIPAVLVPRYLAEGARRGCLPPFDDLDENRLSNWFCQHEKLLLFRLGTDGLTKLRTDIDRLLHHSDQWKTSELALFRRPWKLLRRGALSHYRDQYRQQRFRDGIIDQATHQRLHDRAATLRLLWWLGLLPSRLAKLSQKLVANQAFRGRVSELMHSGDARTEAIKQWKDRKQAELIESENCPLDWQASTGKVILHAVVAKILPCHLHRWLSDRPYRRDRATRLALLLCSPTFQSWTGNDWVEQAITRWQNEQRLGDTDCQALRQELSGDLVRVYVRGFAMHLALKTLAPLWMPIKLAGAAAFAVTFNPLYLLAFLITPALRFLITLHSWATQGNTEIRHAEAMAIGWLPMVGLAAFPLQMLAARPKLSTFLIRDLAAKIGRRVPIYGGKDSRTEIALIGMTDEVIAAVTKVASWLPRLTGWWSPATTSTAQQPRTLRFESYRLVGWKRLIEKRAQTEIAKIKSQRQSIKPQIEPDQAGQPRQRRAA